MCIACWGYTLEVKEQIDTRHKEDVRMWREVALSHSHCAAGPLRTRTTAGSHTIGCMVEYSAEITDSRDSGEATAGKFFFTL